jgi:hypothetical protein
MLVFVELTGLGITVPAEICTDDGAKWARFDASGWFATAPVESIVDLAQHGWTSRRVATDVARFGKADCSEVAELLQYVMFLRHGGLEGGCTCTIDRVAALEWLAYRRPEVFARVRAQRVA